MRQWLTRNVVPLWVVVPLIFLGMVFVVFYPLGHSWFRYGAALVMAVVFGWWYQRRASATVLERSETDTERIMIVRQVWKKQMRRK